jgi:hypothetical protein
MLKVPTKLEVKANFEEYQALSNKLIKLLNDVETERRLADNKNILQDLLDAYAKSYNLLIVYAYITEEQYSKKEKLHKLTYYDPENSVYIYYFSRFTTYLNETDIFADITIIINGMVIVKLEYQ